VRRKGWTRLWRQMRPGGATLLMTTTTMQSEEEV
jgi:hypothetical protein